MDRKTTNPSNREGLQLRSEFRSVSTTTSSSSDFVLQWGNRKRVRCMKVQSKNQTINNEPVTVQRSTTRIDRRVVSSDLNNNKSSTRGDPTSNHKNIIAGGNGFLNLRHRPAYPSPRILRNTENSMKGHSNGVRSFVSPDRGDRKGTTSTSNNNIHNNHHHSKSCNGGSRYNHPTDVKKLDGCNEKATLWLPNFVFALTNKEKEEDFFAIKGCKLPQRPKKRAKVIQRTVNLVSPGAWLCDVTLERYEVREKKVPKKRPRGLKAMGNMDSDSE